MHFSFAVISIKKKKRAKKKVAQSSREEIHIINLFACLHPLTNINHIALCTFMSVDLINLKAGNLIRTSEKKIS